MKKFTLLFLVFHFSFFTFHLSMAQDIPISGKVTSAEDKQPIPGVTVIIRGTTIGTVTGINGEYSINAPSNGVLVFSYIGMQKQELEIDGRRVINCEMAAERVDLGEVVVMGYNNDSKKLITGSFAVVKNDQIKTIPLRTVDGVLEGQTAGVAVVQNSGTPGGQNSIKIRGGSSINATNQPLIVIDGIPAITGDYSQISYLGQEIDALSDLNPDDIEQMTILKDASATSIYGARASNGVILITTKKGSYDQTNVSLNNMFGWQTMPKERLLHMMDAQEWNEYKGTDVQGINTDWMKEILQVAPTSNSELSVSTGNAKTRLYVSGSYYNQEGTVKSTDFDRYSGKLSVDHKLLPGLTIGGGAYMMYSTNWRVEGDQTTNGPLPNAMSIPAIYPVYNADGTYNEMGPYANPVAIINETKNVAYANRADGNVYLEYKFLDGFIFTSKWSTDIYNLREHEYDPITTRQGAKYNGLGIEGTSYTSNLVTNNVLQYVKSLKERHNFDVLAGYSFEKYANRATYIEAINFPNENFQYIESAATIRAASASTLDRAMNSFFGQFKYNYLYKLIVTLTARTDGSSKFGENNRYGFFPAASVAWRIAEEHFMDKAGKIDELKLRGSIGLTGNDGIPDFASLGLYYGSYDYEGNPGIAPTQLPNPNLKWETTLQTGLGLDFAMFNSRIALTADLYFNKTKDLLLARPLPPSTGYISIYDNIGNLENKGIELVLNTENLVNAFKWNTSFVFAANRNKVTKLYQGQPIADQGRGGNWVMVGEPIGIFYDYRCLGVDPTTGDLVYDDINHDGVINSDDWTKIGDPNPDFTYGITNTFSFKNIDLSIFLQGVSGNDVFNGSFLYLESGTGEDNQTVAMINRWKKPGDVTDMPRVGDMYQSSRFIENGSFMRIKNVTLGYNFPKELMHKIKMKSARIYIAGENLFTFTTYEGMDPEVNYYGNDNVVLGTDFFTYPQSRTVMIGLNLGF
jgi:TonB-dependent starch-binding outer membrane protein SusC